MRQTEKPSLWSQPRSVYLVAFTEFWERFSYYGMLALLVLFLTGMPAQGGLGWHSEQALRVYGFFAGLTFCLPAVGGWITDRWIGERTGVLLGGLGIFAGNLALFGLSPALPSTLVHALLFVGLASIALGTGLLKPAISTLVGRVYDARPGSSRSAGYTIFMMCIYTGSVAGTLIAGALGELTSFRWGFFAAAVGMASGLTLYVSRSPRLLGDIGKRPAPSAFSAVVAEATERDQTNPSGAKSKAIPAILLLLAFTTVYGVGFFQKGGVLALMIKSSTDRMVAGYEIPASTFLSVSTIGFVLLAPIVEILMTKLARRSFHIDPIAKLIVALLILAAAYIFFQTAASTSAYSATGLHSAGWIIAGYLCFSLGDTLVWPVQISMISRLSPPQLTGILIGVWYFTMGIGSALAGFLGVYAERIGLGTYFSIIQLVLVIAAVLLFFIRASSPTLREAVRENPLAP